MMLGRRRRRTRHSENLEPEALVGELFVAAQGEAIAFRHDWIGPEHVLLALLGREDETGRTLRSFGLGLELAREDVRRIVGAGPGRDAAFDAAALDAIGIDLGAVRARVEASFGEGALERASRRRGSCAGAAFGVAPGLKRALESARHDALQRGTPLSSGDVALALARQGDSVAARILDSRAISPQRLSRALGDDPGRD